MMKTATKNDEMKITTRLMLSGRPGSARDADRSVEFIAATEVPARIYDFERGEVVDEVLLMDGVVLPDNRQVPLLDSHDRMSVEAILGSMREFAVEEGKLIGRAFFSKRQKASDAFMDVVEGHLTDVSVGYAVRESSWIPEGTSQIVMGRTFFGPVKVSSRWELKEVSLTPIGADPMAKARSEQLNNPQATARGESENKQEEKEMPETIKVEKTAEVTTSPAAATTPAVDVEGVRSAAIEAEKMRARDILEACRTVGQDNLASDLIERGLPIDKAILEIHRAVAAAMPASKPASVQTVADESDKLRSAMTDGILLRAGVINESSKVAPGAEDFRGRSVLQMAEEWLSKRGVNTRRMSRNQLAGIAIRGAYAIVGNTADFPQILVDAANKSLQKGYMEFPRTWNIWTRAASVPDFRTNYRPQLSEAPDLDEVLENGEYTEAKFNDFYESYAIATYAKRFTISRKALINDDLNAFVRIPQAFGQAASRKIEQIVYSILTTNAVLSDSVALFENATHANLPTAAALSSTSLAAAMSAMMKQKGNGEDTAYIGAIPRFLIVPVALKFTADILVASASLAEATQSSGVFNPFRGLQVVVNPLLDASSSTAWYLAADPNAIDTIEVGFLDGVQTPMLEETEQSDIDGRVFKVRLDVGAKALDYRGLLKNAGA